MLDALTRIKGEFSECRLSKSPLEREKGRRGVAVEDDFKKNNNPKLTN